MANDFKTIELGEGVLTVNSQVIGYVRGGTFNDNAVYRHIEADGKKGNIVGDAIVESYDVMLEITALQMESANIVELFQGTAAADVDGVKTITRSTIAPVAADYHATVTFVGQTVEGKDVTISLTNVLAEGPMNFTYGDKVEVEIPCILKANDSAIGATVMPYTLVIDESTGA